MTKFDEMNEGIGFADTFKAFPDHFSFENQQKMNLALERLNLLLSKYDSVASAFNEEFFSDEEIDGYALWRASVYYSNHPPQVRALKRKVFEAVLSRFTQHYRTLAGKES